MRLRSLLSLLATAALFPAGVSAQFCFSKNYVDLHYPASGRPGWVQAGDVDGDGDLDLVAGGGRALVVYENDGNARGWARYANLDSTGQMGANAGVLLDVDGDGDLDVISARYNNDVGWWQNPGGPLSNATWSFHRLGTGISGWYMHDMILADLDGDGVAEEIVVSFHRPYWNADVQIYWYRRDPRPGTLWPIHQVQSPRREQNHCHSGFAVGDIDRDGNVDISYSDGWYEAPADPTGSWTWHRVATDVYGISNSRVVDVDRDGRLDLVVSAGHHGTGVYWYRAPANPVNGTWSKRVIDTVVVHPEGLQVHDFDGDGDLDVLACELFFGEQPGEPRWDEEKHNIYVYENGGGPGPWRKINIAPDSFPSHLPYLVDINGDGRMDIISEGAGHSVVSYYEALQPGFALSGQGLPGGSGTAPTIEGGCCPTPGRDLEVTIRGGPAGALGWLNLGLRTRTHPLPWGGTVLGAEPTWVIGYALGGAGEVVVALSVPNQLRLKGLDLYAQGALLDAGASHGLSATRVLLAPIR